MPEDGDCDESDDGDEHAAEDLTATIPDTLAESVNAETCQAN